MSSREFWVPKVTIWGKSPSEDYDYVEIKNSYGDVIVYEDHLDALITCLEKARDNLKIKREGE